MGSCQILQAVGGYDEELGGSMGPGVHVGSIWKLQEFGGKSGTWLSMQAVEGCYKNLMGPVYMQAVAGDDRNLVEM